MRFEGDGKLKKGGYLNKRLRVEYPGAMYHVIQRGNNREFIFDRNKDKCFILDSMKQVFEFYGVDMIAYVIMGNHYHLVVRTWENGLGKIMHRLNTRFSVYYNQDKKRSGHVFQGRYQATPIEDERYLMAVVRYIHRNPVRAGICQKVEDYRWSSDSYYCGNDTDWVKKDLLLNLLAMNQNKAISEYLRLMECSDDEDIVTHLAIQSQGLIPPMQFQNGDSITSDVLLDDILLTTGVDEEQFRLIKAGSRKRELTRLKSVYVTRAVKQGYPLQDIADNIGISKVAVYKLSQM
jgi:REP element-mobilizing transposase RayT